MEAELFLSSVNLKKVVFRFIMIAPSNVNGILTINAICEDLFACILEDVNDTLRIRWQHIFDKVTPEESESKSPNSGFLHVVEINSRVIN